MKMPLSSEQKEWSDMLTIDQRKPNPCVRLYGIGPEGLKCKTCNHLYHHKGKYIKCDLRTHTNGPGSDHKSNWQACAKYTENHL